MNKKFIKKNIFLLIFMSMAMIAVVALLIMVFFEHKSMKKYDSKKAELLAKINKIFKQKYAPVKVNVARIESDIAGYKKEIVKIEKKFGKPYASALKSFVEVVDIPLDEFKVKFGEFWEKQRGRTTRDLIFRRYKVRQFSEDFPNHKSNWDAAMNKFMQEAQKVTLEKIDASNVDGIFLAVMGKGRRFSDSPSRCLIFMKLMRYRMVEYFGKKKVNCEHASDFSFDHDKLPLAGDIEQIAKAWEIISDLAKRIADAKVNPEDRLELEKFSKRGLDGERNGNYTSYRFNFTISGDLATIRRVVKKLYEGHKENRIYAVRNIAISRIVDNVNNILAECEKIKEELDYDEAIEKKDKLREPDKKNAGLFPRFGKTRSGLSRRFGEQVNNGVGNNGQPAKVAKKKKKILGPKDPGYAKMIIGSNNICRAEFEVDYIIFNDSQNN